MNRLRDDTYSNFRKGAVLSLFTGATLIIISFLLSKKDFFLLLNHDLGTMADYFFSYATYLGDGIVWIPVAVLVIIFRRPQFLLMFCSIAISTLIVQAIKHFFIPAQPRPGASFADHSLFHHVNWVPLHTHFSFPSGHTTTAFSVFLLGCLLINKKWIVPAGFAYALATGYSRIYLAQHFPLDVGSGMLIAVLSVWLSVLIQKKWEQKAQAI